MNFRIIAYIVGWVCNFQAMFMVLPCITALIYQEHEFFAFLISMIVCLIVGLPLTIRKPKNKVFYTKDGCVAVALSWFALCISGAVPFVLSGAIPHPIDAFFETVSGFTTTGSSILTDVEVLPHCILIWRSFTHWIGGMGVLVFLLSLLPLAGGYHMNLMKAESPGPSVSKLVPQVQSTAKILYSIYLTLTVIEFVLLLFGKMSVFDALTTSFGTAGTGGFSIMNDSMGGFSDYTQIVVTIFMIAFGINFSFYYLLILKKAWKDALKLSEVRVYIGIIIVASLLIMFNIQAQMGSYPNAAKHAFFQAASIITTTGYSTVDFNQWPEFSKTIMIGLMFIGACAGSTGGGMKVSRLCIMAKTVMKELAFIIHPRNVRKTRFEGKTVEHEVLRSINVFLVAYLGIFVLSVMLISLDNFDFATNFTAVAATLNNIGPGLAKVGPTQNFGIYSNFSKLVLAFDMLAGRLEIFPMLVPMIYLLRKKQLS